MTHATRNRFAVRATPALVPALCCAVACIAWSGGCEESGSSNASTSSSNSNTTGGGLAEQPSSLLGRSADAARNVREIVQSGHESAPTIDQAGPIEVAGMLFDAPMSEGWRVVQPTNDMRLAQLAYTTPTGEATVTITRSGGSIIQNVTRWGGQMLDDVGGTQRPRAERREVNNLVIHTVSMNGTFLDGPPRGAQTERPFWSFRGAIVENPPEGGDMVFVKMTGPEDVVERAMPGWQELLLSARPAE